MKNYSILLFASLVAFGCKKDDIILQKSVQEVQGVSKPDAPGNLHTRVLNELSLGNSLGAGQFYLVHGT